MEFAIIFYLVYYSQSFNNEITCEMNDTSVNNTLCNNSKLKQYFLNISMHGLI